MLAQTSHGGLIKIRLDMVSVRPHVTTTFQLQGTAGCFESTRRSDESDRIWLSSLHPEPQRWGKLEDLRDEYMPAAWQEMMADLGEEGHGGTDTLVSLAFIDALLADRSPPIDVDRAMDMTLPGLISQHSMTEAGAWLDVPDSRDWTATEVPEE